MSADATGRTCEALLPTTTGGEGWVAITVRDSLHEAVAHVVAGGPARWVPLHSVVDTLLRYNIDIACDVERGIYLATWGRPVGARLVMGHAGTGILVSQGSSR